MGSAGGRRPGCHLLLPVLLKALVKGISTVVANFTGKGGEKKKRGYVCFFTEKQAIFLASHFLSSLCYYCRYVFE